MTKYVNPLYKPLVKLFAKLNKFNGLAYALTVRLGELRKKIEHKSTEKVLSETFTEEASPSYTTTTDPMAKIVKSDNNSSSSYEIDEPSEELVPDNLIEVHHTPEGFNYR